MDFDPNALPIPDLGLRCLNCSYDLFGLPSHRCPECGRTIILDDYIPRGDFPFVIHNGREVTLDATIEQIMRRAGILYMFNRMPAEAAFGIGSTNAREGKLAVERCRYFEAIYLLKRYIQSGEMPPERVVSDELWNCPKCNEENPASFDLCWNCSMERFPSPT